MREEFQPYRRLSVHSGIQAYRSGRDFIEIIFNDGDTYLYTNKKTGKKNIDKMKKLAEQGEGLSTFINQNVHGLWEEKSKSRWDGFRWIKSPSN